MENNPVTVGDLIKELQKYPSTLEEYKKRYNEAKAQEDAFYTRSTNIKCEYCIGIYHYVDSREVYTSIPPKTKVKCTNCDDEEFIPC